MHEPEAIPDPRPLTGKSHHQILRWHRRCGRARRSREYGRVSLSTSRLKRLRAITPYALEAQRYTWGISGTKYGYQTLARSYPPSRGTALGFDTGLCYGSR